MCGHDGATLTSWERPAIGEPNDALIRDIHRFGGDRLLQDDQPPRTAALGVVAPLGPRRRAGLTSVGGGYRTDPR